MTPDNRPRASGPRAAASSSSGSAESSDRAIGSVPRRLFGGVHGDKTRTSKASGWQAGSFWRFCVGAGLAGLRPEGAFCSEARLGRAKDKPVVWERPRLALIGPPEIPI